METLYVDKETNHIALFKPVEIKTRAELFDLGRIESVEEAVEMAHSVYPLAGLLEWINYELWEDAWKDGKDQNLEPVEFDSPDDLLLTLKKVGGEDDVLRQINQWLSESPDGEDWEHGDESVSPFLAAFRFFEDKEFPQGLEISLVEGFHPGDNSQVVVLDMTVDDANAIAAKTGFKFVTI